MCMGQLLRYFHSTAPLADCAADGKRPKRANGNHEFTEFIFFIYFIFFAFFILLSA
jgi:hypothetical protein